MEINHKNQESKLSLQVNKFSSFAVWSFASLSWSSMLVYGSLECWWTSPESLHVAWQKIVDLHCERTNYILITDCDYFSREKQHRWLCGVILCQCWTVQAAKLSWSLFPRLLFHVFKHWWRSEGCLTWQRAAAELRHRGGRISIDNKSWILSLLTNW